MVVRQNESYFSRWNNFYVALISISLLHPSAIIVLLMWRSCATFYPSHTDVSKVFLFVAQKFFLCCSHAIFKICNCFIPFQNILMQIGCNPEFVCAKYIIPIANSANKALNMSEAWRLIYQVELWTQGYNGSLIRTKLTNNICMRLGGCFASRTTTWTLWQCFQISHNCMACIGTNLPKPYHSDLLLYAASIRRLLSVLRIQRCSSVSGGTVKY